MQKSFTQKVYDVVSKIPKGKKAIIFCESIEHLRHIATLLPSSVTLHSKQNSLVNDENFKKFEEGKVRHALVVDKFNEGIDVPDTDLIVFLRATGSRRIFLQQLGRGLRLAKGKKKVTVLDFVANIERIKQVQKLMFDIEGHAGGRRKGSKNGIDSPFHVEGKGFQFDFDAQIVNVLLAFEKVDVPSYETLEEAKNAVQKLGIKSHPEYRKRYKEDLRLPSAPDVVYKDFPGFSIFLGNSIKEKYETWQQALKAVRKLRIKSKSEYLKRYKEDTQLPSQPQKYPGFPGWAKFVGKKNGKGVEKYKTWQEAAKAAKRLKLFSWLEYLKKYKKDPKLPFHPERYSGFPGFDVFLGLKK